MPKKILLAEKSDAIRSIAESILHQNGYDVISASGAEKTKELIITAKPNLMIIGADLSDGDGVFLYDSIEDNPLASSIPLLLIADPQGKSLPFPDEVIIPRPFDPKEFIDRVRLFVGGGIEPAKDGKVQVAEPFAIGNIDDEFLDAALGIDSLDVEASEIMAGGLWNP
jgi:DNA-binding response OmpR family regulator